MSSTPKVLGPFSTRAFKSALTDSLGQLHILSKLKSPFTNFLKPRSYGLFDNTSVTECGIYISHSFSYIIVGLEYIQV